MTQLPSKPTIPLPDKEHPTKITSKFTSRSWLNLQNVSLRLILVVPFVLQICVAVGLTGWLSLRNGQQAVNDVASQLRAETSDRIQQYLLNYLDKPYLVHEVTAAAIQSGKLSVTDLPGLEQYFWFLVQQQAITAYNFGNPQGVFVGVERLEDGQIVAKFRDESTAPQRGIYSLDNQGRRMKLLRMQEFDPRNRPWYEAALTAKQSTWSAIYPLASADYSAAAISTVKPIYNNDVLQGVLSINLNLTEISEFLKNIKISQSGQTFIVERSGELVASSGIERPFVVKDQKSERLQAANTDNVLVRATTQQLIKQFNNLRSIDQSQQIDFKLNGERQFVQVQPFRHSQGIDWLIVVVVPESDFMARIEANTRTTILLCIGALLLATILGVLTSRWITAPILKLNQASKVIARGELDQQVDVQGTNELGELAQSFNQMATQLHHSFATLEQTNTVLEQTNHELEQRVDARTAELRQAKESAEQAKEALQQRVNQLLQEVTPIREGDLTIQAQVTADEIGTIADSYNTMVKSLQAIVVQVQSTAQYVAEATSVHESSVRELHTGASQQAIEIAQALQRTEQMAEVVHQLTIRAQKAAAAVQQATEAVAEGDIAMNRTVNSITAIETTVLETVDKVKHLGEASQEISAVVGLIKRFADQTNLLALNASVEASRAGQEGQSFMVIAAEVRTLAQQSAEATEAIRKLVATIQAETNEVVAAIESSSKQVTTGTELVNHTRQSLNKITAVNAQISELVATIAEATLVQSQGAETITATMQGVAAIANKTSTEAQQVSAAFEQLSQMTQDLQSDVGRFKVRANHTG